jgi:hypothetical protein
MTLGLLLVAIPFGFAALRALGTGTDLRYAWVALAAAGAAAALLVPGGRRSRPSAARQALAVVVSTAAASAAGFVQGAHSLPAVLFVAMGFAVCEVGGIVLMQRSRAG